MTLKAIVNVEVKRRVRGGGLVGTVEQAVDVSSAHLCGVLMTVVWVLEVEWETGLERERKADVLDAEDMWWR